jgi:hypothetical protein
MALTAKQIEELGSINCDLSDIRDVLEVCHEAIGQGGVEGEMRLQTMLRVIETLTYSAHDSLEALGLFEDETRAA